MNSKESFGLFIRYLILILVGLFGIQLIYSIFTPLTTYPVLWILKLAHSVILEGGNRLIFDGSIINIIPACVAGAAYYLLLILNLATPMNFKTRIKSISFLLISFLVLNIIRIALFAQLFIAGFAYFDLAHRFVWYAGSTILVVALWFVNIKLFKIRAIPAYTDLKNFINKNYLNKP